MLGYAKTRFIKMAFQRANDSKIQSTQQIVDLDGNLHNTNETAKTSQERKKVALRAMANEQHNHLTGSKDRPIAASSSEAWEADQKRLEEEQFAAYSEGPIPSAEVKNAPLSALDEENDLFKGVKFGSHDCTAKNEVITVGPFSDGIPQIMLGLWNGDIADSDSKNLSYEARHQLKFFGKTIQETALMPLAKRVATLILGGDEEEVEEAIATVKKYPEILHCPPVIARDRSDSPDFRLMTRETDAELKKGEKHLYIGRAEDGGLDYKILDAQGNPIVGYITPKELGQEVKADPALTLPDLNKLRGVILNITSKRGHTPKGRAVKAKILQIAAMAGDFDLQEGMEEKIQQAGDKEKIQKQRGIVERLAAIENGLSPDEVKAQLEEVLTGEKAKQQNQQRVDRITEAVKRFGEGLLIKKQEYKGNLKDYNNFPEFQILCQPLIDQLRKVLQHDPKEVTTSGRIFDESILYKAADWFEYGYELCPMPNQPDKEIKLEKGKLYLEEKEGYLAYSVITPDEKEVRHIKINVDAPKSFELDKLNESALKEKIFAAASKAEHIVTNLNRFGGWWSIVSDVFWVNGFGQLQSLLSSRDKDVAHHGIGKVVDSKEIPPRGSCSLEGISYINSSSGCGVSHLLGYYGLRAQDADTPFAVDGLRAGRGAVGKLMSSKNNSIAKFMQCPAPSKQGRCVIL